MPDVPAKPALATQVVATAAPALDVVILGPPTADGAGVQVLRARDEKVEIGELRALEEGRPIVGEIVTLAPRKHNPRVCDVKDSYRAPGSPGTTALAVAVAHKGPAKVSTEAYREGWDEIFGKKPPGPPSAAN